MDDARRNPFPKTQASEQVPIALISEAGPECWLQKTQLAFCCSSEPPAPPLQLSGLFSESNSLHWSALVPMTSSSQQEKREEGAWRGCMRCTG